MEAAFGWLGQFIEYLASFIPRWKVIKATDAGVSFVRGKNVKEIRPGLYWHWPIWTEYIIIPVVRQTLDLPDQTLTTADEVPITVSSVIVYEVTDVVKALTVQWDLEDTIHDICQVAVRRYTVGRTFEEIRTGDERELKDEVRKSLARYGVAIREASIVNIAKTKVLTVVGGGTVVTNDYEEE
jgi:regulator of protease activity HflC (stomatin/prohibitin superfamily)